MNSRKPELLPCGKAAKVPLTKGKHALIDSRDIDWVSQNPWCVRVNPAENFYACRGIWVKGRPRFVHLHREVFSKHKGEIPPSLEIDHINQDSLDNRLENLRAVTRSENNRNRRCRKNKPSGLPKGVFLARSRLNPFKSQIVLKDGKTLHLGVFPTVELAEAAFNKKHAEISSCQ